MSRTRRAPARPPLPHWWWWALVGAFVAALLGWELDGLGALLVLGFAGMSIAYDVYAASRDLPQ